MTKCSPPATCCICRPALRITASPKRRASRIRSASRAPSARRGRGRRLPRLRPPRAPEPPARLLADPPFSPRDRARRDSAGAIGQRARIRPLTPKRRQPARRSLVRRAHDAPQTGTHARSAAANSGYRPQAEAMAPSIARRSEEGRWAFLPQREGATSFTSPAKDRRFAPARRRARHAVLCRARRHDAATDPACHADEQAPRAPVAVASKRSSPHGAASLHRQRRLRRWAAFAGFWAMKR